MTSIDSTLDALYDNRAAVPEHPAIFQRWRDRAAATRTALPGHWNLAYGNHRLQTLDLFPAKANRGLVVFIHGGYWRSLDKSDFSFLAKSYAAQGINTALINYRLCPEATIADIVDDCRNAIAWLAGRAGDYGVRIDPLVLAGHSAGGHLVSMMYTVDWAAEGVHPGLFGGGVALSGLYALSPLLRISVNADLKLDASAAEALSPVRLKPLLNVPLDIAVGGAETSEFIRQSVLLAPAWPGIASESEVVAGANHFTIVDRFADSGSPTFQRTLRFFS